MTLCVLLLINIDVNIVRVEVENAFVDDTENVELLLLFKFKEVSLLLCQFINIVVASCSSHFREVLLLFFEFLLKAVLHVRP